MILENKMTIYGINIDGLETGSFPQSNYCKSTNKSSLIQIKMEKDENSTVVKNNDSLQYLTEIFNAEVSMFSNVRNTVNPRNITIMKLLSDISTGVYAEIVNKAHDQLKLDKNMYDIYKKSYVPGFTLSANCNHRKKVISNSREAEAKLNYHTGILQIDIDKIGIDRLPEIKQIIQSDKHTLFSFVSLSGEGLKAGIMIDGNNHKESFLQAEKYYKQAYNLVIDPSVKGVFRLCFVSFDPELFVNPLAQTFTIQESSSIGQGSLKLLKTKKQSDSIISTDRKIKYANQAVDNAKKILNDSTRGNRHNSRLRAGEFLGGYIEGGFFTKENALIQIESTVLRNTDLPIDKAMNTIEDGIEHGMNNPITIEDLENNRQKYINSNLNFSNQNMILANNIGNEHNKSEIPFYFWYESENAIGKIALKIEYVGLYLYLKSVGIRKIILDGCSLNRVLVRVVNNIVSEIDITGIRNILNQYIDSLPYKISENKTKRDLREVLTKGINQYLNGAGIDTNIPFEEHNYLTDTKDCAFIFFRNGFVEVSKKGIIRKEYRELTRYVWKSQIIPHDFIVIQEDEIHLVDNFDFAKFTQNICISRDTKILDIKRHQSLISTIGYLLHNYKTSSNKFAVILSESNVDNEPAGRTGKGLLLKSIGYLRKVTYIDGKMFSFDSPFAYQKVELDTQILFFDDVSKNFPFQKLFSTITEGLSFERKHKDRINLSAEQSPKIVISTTTPSKAILNPIKDANLKWSCCVITIRHLLHAKNLEICSLMTGVRSNGTYFIISC